MIEKMDLNQEHIDFMFNDNIWGEHKIVAICGDRQDAINIMKTNKHYVVKAICSLRNELFIVMSYEEIMHD